MKPTLDPQVFFRREYESAAPALPFDAATPEEASAWAKKARARLRRLIGSPGKPGGPVKSRVVEERKFPGYSRTKLELETQPGLLAPAYYLLPDDRPARGPAVLAVPGHGKSVEDLIGGVEGEGDPLDYALQCCRAGLPTLAMEQLAFGSRRHEEAIRANPDGGTYCIVPAGAALMLGRTMIGYRVLDARRALDWLSARPEVDPGRLGMTGISGGGQITFFTTAADTRIRACLVSGYFNTFRDSVYSIYHCTDNFVPGILRWYEMPDMVGMIAPRYAFFEQGDRDPIFPAAGFRQAVAKAREVYAAWGVPKRMGAQIFPGEHEWNGGKGIPWLVKSLSGSG